MTAKLISKANNPGCSKCKFQTNKEHTLTECKIKYDEWEEDPIYARCITANEEGQCISFKGTLSYKIASFFKGDWCGAFGHKIYSTGDISSSAICERYNCGYTEPALKWPDPPHRNFRANPLVRTTVLLKKSDDSIITIADEVASE